MVGQLFTAMNRGGGPFITAVVGTGICARIRVPVGMSLRYRTCTMNMPVRVAVVMKFFVIPLGSLMATEHLLTAQKCVEMRMLVLWSLLRILVLVFMQLMPIRTGDGVVVT